jgi:hypothetical protein
MTIIQILNKLPLSLSQITEAVPMLYSGQGSLSLNCYCDLWQSCSSSCMLQSFIVICRPVHMSLRQANSLLDLTYAFINCCVAASSNPPPFEIPCLCFIHAGLTLSFLPGQMIIAKPGAKPCSVQAAFLLEELILGGPDAFVKFIHNMDCDPLLDPGKDGYSTALFLAFTQHVQYEKTGGLAYISNYQGV